jgi:ribokinase
VPSPPRVVVVGSINVDLVVSVSRLPVAGETVAGGRFAQHGGGKSANQAVAAARVGAAVAFVGAVGADELGEAAVAELESEGIEVSHVARVAAPTGVALIVVDAAGENSIVVVPGANARLSADDVERALGEQSPVVLAQLEVPEEAVAAAARAAGRFVLNASPVRPLPAALLEAADPLIVNAGEAAAITGADDADPATLAAAALALGVRSIVVTLGARGARWTTPEWSIERPAPAVGVVDTTGAGDVFAGTLAAQLSRGFEPESALDAAVHAGAEAVQWRGAQDLR